MAGSSLSFKFNSKSHLLQEAFSILFQTKTSDIFFFFTSALLKLSPRFNDKFACLLIICFTFPSLEPDTEHSQPTGPDVPQAALTGC